MPSAISLGGRIRTNVSAELAYQSYKVAENSASRSRLNLTTGKRINSAADDVSGYITTQSLNSRNTSLQVSVRAAQEAKNVASIVQDSLDNIHGLLTEIRSSATLASSGSIGRDEKVALAKSSYRLAQQIDSVQNSTVFSGQQLLDGEFNAEWVVGFSASFSTQTIQINLASSNLELNVSSQNFTLDIFSNSSNQDIIVNDDSDDDDDDFEIANFAATSESVQLFAGVTSLDLSALNDVSDSDLGVFSNENIDSFISRISEAMTNVTNVAAYVGAIDNRLNYQIDTLRSQTTNYASAISRINDADVAQEQLNLSKKSFLQQSSLVSLSQANSNPVNFFRLLV
jgi:flagellin